MAADGGRLLISYVHLPLPRFSAKKTERLFTGYINARTSRDM